MFEYVKSTAKIVFTRFNLLIWAVLSFVLALAGPFGTFELQGFGARLGYWSIVVVVSGVIGDVVFQHAPRLVPPNRPLLADLVCIGLNTVLFTPILVTLTRGMVLPPDFPGPTVAEFLIYVLVVTAAIAVFLRMMSGSGVRPTDPSDSQSGGPPRLQRRLPAGFSGKIQRLMSRDHFVDVVTTGGTFTLRMRLSDAIDEMDTVPGLCTHRSHWVALSAAQSVERSGGRTTLALNNGERVPVSRKYKPGLDAAGLT